MSMSSNVNYRSMNGIIEFDDGNGGLLSGGNLTSQDANITNGALIGGTSNIHKLDIADVLTLDGTLNVNSVPISPVWLSYLQDCGSNIQDQINAIVASTYVLLGNNNTWTGTNVFDNTVTLDATTRCNESIVFKGGEGTYFRNMADTAGASLFYDETRGFWNNVIGSSKLTYSVGQADKMLISSSGVNMVSPVTFFDTVSGLHATSIANGTISDSEYETLNGVTGNIQLQLESKQPQVNELFPVSASAIGDVSYTSTDPVTNTEYSYLRGVTSAIQTQINAITSSLLANNNTWSGTNVFNDNVYMNSLEWNSNASTLPTYDGNGRGAIQGRSEAISSMCFINNNSNEDASTSAFLFYKMFNSSVLTPIAWLSNVGDFNCNGVVTSASVETTDIATDNITTDTLTVNTSAVLPIGSKLNILGSTAGSTAPVAGTGGYIYCRGQTTYGNSVSSMNAFSNTANDTIAFDWSKRTGTTTDLMRLFNAGDLWVKGFFQSKVLIQDIVEFSSDYTFTDWRFIPAIIMITADCNITMTEFNPTGLRTTVIRKTGNVTVKSARVARNQIFVGGVNNYSFLFNGGTTSIDLIYDANGSWVVFN